MRNVTAIAAAILFLLCIKPGQAQDPKGVYFIFTSVSNNIAPGSVHKEIFSSKEEWDEYKTPPLEFRFYFNNNLSSAFWHYERIKPKIGDTNVKEKDKHKVYIRDETFLDGVQCYDWDDIKRMEWFPWLDFKKKIRHKNIYVIDRNDSKDGKIKIYQVKMY